jgi:hypothetical protein
MGAQYSRTLALLITLASVALVHGQTSGSGQTVRPGIPEAQAGSDTLGAVLQRDWSSQKGRIVALAEAMPAEKYEFRPTPPQMTYGEQLLHLAEAHVAQLKKLDTGGTVPAPSLPKETTRPAVTRAVTEAYDYGAAVLAKASGQLTPPQVQAIVRAMNNAMNHYGQCVVYLRLNDIVPPASRR